MKLFTTICFLALFTACKSVGTLPAAMDEKEDIERLFTESEVFSQSITGFVLYDPGTGEILHSRDADRLFTPASNTKIFTLYASLKALPDTLPSLRYEVKNDTLYFRGTADPSFLNPHFDSEAVYSFLKNREETLVYYDGHFDDDHFGSGWSWEWYPAAYAPEKSPFPVYGNMMRLQTRQVALNILDESTAVKPAYFERFIEHQGWDGNQTELVRRGIRDNRLTYVPKSDTVRYERNIPFVYDSELFLDILADTLGRDIGFTDRKDLTFSQTLYATPADTLYKRMMLISDNFVAEQLMLMISDQEFDSMNTMRVIRHSVSEYMGYLPDTPAWNDGSGLSRYNLFTPRTIAVLLQQLLDEYGKEKTLSWFPAGGVSGTISGLYRNPDGADPYVYAKTGTLRNNTALSGYVLTDSGRTLIFSFMNNNYVISNNAMRAEMGKVLEHIKKEY